MTQPGVKKNKDGTWTITGVQERVVTKTQVDYEDLVKASQLIPGQQGVSARELILKNPEMSGGLLASLSKTGAVPDNDLVTTLVQIDKMTQAQREKDVTARLESVGLSLRFDLA